jgi:hypothetical protein
MHVRLAAVEDIDSTQSVMFTRRRPNCPAIGTACCKLPRGLLLDSKPSELQVHAHRNSLVGSTRSYVAPNRSLLIGEAKVDSKVWIDKSLDFSVRDLV